MIFYIPPEESIYPESWAAVKRAYGISDDEWDVNRVGADLEALCRRNAIDYVNPEERFKEAAAELAKGNMRLCFARDGHWTARGHRLAGEILADYIDSTGVLRGP